ncbi:MAG: ribokinase [Lentisphaerae bacterium]|nr:ribokinase [Lentisphaerota bacterium]
MHVPRIVVVGSINTDMVVQVERMPAIGETVTAGRFAMPAGGKGANQAVAAARLGADVTLVARVGGDPFGANAIQNFENERIRTSFIRRDDSTHTGVAVIMVDARGQNVIAVAPGANAAVTCADVDRAADHIRRAHAVLLQLEIPMDVVVHTARLAAEARVPVIFDPAPAAPLPADLLKYVDYITPNETEAGRLTGVAVSDRATAETAAQRLLAAGARRVIVTLGAQGALVVERGRTTLVPSVAVTVQDTTAAGDAFNGGLAVALAAGLTLEAAVRRACVVGALAATRMGAQPSLPTAAEVETFLATLSPNAPV